MSIRRIVRRSGFRPTHFINHPLNKPLTPTRNPLLPNHNPKMSTVDSRSPLRPPPHPSGRMTENRLPSPTTLSTRSQPRWRLTMCFTMASPSPVPPLHRPPHQRGNRDRERAHPRHDRRRLVARDGPRAQRDVHGRRGSGRVLPAVDGAVGEVVNPRGGPEPHLTVQVLRPFTRPPLPRSVNDPALVLKPRISFHTENQSD